MNNYIKSIVEAFDFNGVRNNKNKAIGSNVKDFIINQLVNKIKNEIQPNDDIWNRFKDTPIYSVQSTEELRLLVVNCIKIYKDNCSLNWIDTSNITDMSGLFKDINFMNGYDPWYIDISKWDVSNVKNMREAFSYSNDFSFDLSNWDVSNVEDMSSMFQGYNQLGWHTNEEALANWDVSNVKDMSHMFERCRNFNGDISNWNVSNVKDMKYMFSGCHHFNGDISNWDVSNVEDMSQMFNGCDMFNSDLSAWNVSNVKNMEGLFYHCMSFNSDLSNWDVSNVENMNNMFALCKRLNFDASKWKVKAKTFQMFNGCDAMKKFPELENIN